EEARLAEVGVPVLRERVTRFAHDDGRLMAIELEGREPLERAAPVFFAVMRPRAGLAAALGCELTEAGYVVAHPMTRATSVERIFAAGHVADPSQHGAIAVRHRR